MIRIIVFWGPRQERSSAGRNPQLTARLVGQRRSRRDIAEVERRPVDVALPNGRERRLAATRATANEVYIGVPLS